MPTVCRGSCSGLLFVPFYDLNHSAMVTCVAPPQQIHSEPKWPRNWKEILLYVCFSSFFWVFLFLLPDHANCTPVFILTPVPRFAVGTQDAPDDQNPFGATAATDNPFGAVTDAPAEVLCSPHTSRGIASDVLRHVNVS